MLEELDGASPKDFATCSKAIRRRGLGDRSAEWCFKTTFHGLPPSSCSIGRKSTASHYSVRIRTVALPASPSRLVAATKRPARNWDTFPKTSDTERAMAGAYGGECCSRLTRAVKNVYGGDR